MICPCCGSEIDAEPAAIGSQKPLLQQLTEYERSQRFWDPFYKDLQNKELAQKPDLGHNTLSLPPTKDSINARRNIEPR